MKFGPNAFPWAMVGVLLLALVISMSYAPAIQRGASQDAKYARDTREALSLEEVWAAVDATRQETEKQHEQELAAKDAEIAELRRQIESLSHE